jgi:hypothetical protein
VRDFLSQLFEPEIQARLRRAKGTGAASWILSACVLFVAVYLLVALAARHLWIPFAILLVLSLTPLVSIGGIGLATYSFATGRWILGGLFLCQGAASVLAVWAGRKNIEGILLRGRANIEPFEGAPDLTLLTWLTLGLLAAALATRGTASLVLWIVLGLVAMMLVGRAWFRLFPRWSRLHFPLMFRYAGCAGMEAARSEAMASEFDIHSALTSLVKGCYEYMDEHDARLVVGAAELRMERFEDRADLKAWIANRATQADAEKLEHLMDSIADVLAGAKGRGLLVRYAITEIVERQYGTEERLGYLVAMLRGQTP